MSRTANETKTVDSPAELRAILGEPSERAANKDRTHLHAMDRDWIAHSPFLLIATADAQGNCDVSPKGDPAGFVHVVDERTLAIPERPGNRRADGFLNVLSNPHVGLVFLIPGRNDTLRVNGKARLVSQAPYFEKLEVKGHRPLLALEFKIEQLFYHCAKAFMRSHLWDSSSWSPEAMPSRAMIAKTVENPEMEMAELEDYYGASYADGLYLNPALEKR
ncbi:MAG: pyridoxamine 5'-phosphate oxidase family protein [Myxococcota bacterium]